jgi:hypothetical protein
MGSIKLNDFSYMESGLKLTSFDASIAIKKLFFFKVSVTIEPNRSSLVVCYHERLDVAF